MKKIVISTLSLITSAAIIAAEVPDLSKFKDICANQGSSQNFIEDFERPKKGWKLGRFCKIEKTAGLNGTTAIRCERRSQTDYNSGVASLRLTGLRPGTRYKLSAMYRVANLSKGARVAAPSIEFRKNGKYDTMANPFTKIDDSTAKEWKKKETIFTATTECYLILRLFYNDTGIVWFDDIRIEPIGANYGSIHPLYPRESLLDDSGKVSFRTLTWEKNPAKLAGHLAVIEMNGVKKAVYPDKNGNATVEFGKLPDGYHTCNVSLLNMKDKSIIAKNSYRFRRISNFKRPVTIDEYNRLIINGKPFFPVGIYYTFVRTEKDLKTIADGGFNTILCYTPSSLNVQPEMNEIAKNPAKSMSKDKVEWRKQTKRTLDIIDQIGLKFIGSTGDEVFQHPAVIGPYTADEATITRLPALKKSYQGYLEKTPGYPVIALTDKIRDYVPYSEILDVLGIDPYPLVYKKSPGYVHIEDLRSCLIEANKTGKPVMFVPQAFNWGAHFVNTRYSDYADPTAEEIRTMVLMPVIYGVKWFVFYSYTTITEKMIKYDPQVMTNFWPRVTHSAKLLRELEPWIMSTETAPAVSIANKQKSVVDAKAFSSDGKICVVITACGPGKAEAVITVPGAAGLKSKFGKTKNLGNGKYLFSGIDVISDVLVEENNL